uniref:Rhodanese domain-containing protein n=1 Tax=Hanusia phi TaxID=3032 RepID=A0A7S0NC97_9CRYP
MSTEDLQQLMEDQQQEVVILDVRRRDEFDVSHIKGAICAGEDGELVNIAELTTSWSGDTSVKSKKIACYCSVGYRSARLAQKLLLEHGCKSAFNVEGSIFKWANEGRKVYRGEVEVSPTLVHPYNFTFGQLLNSKYRHPLASNTQNN